MKHLGDITKINGAEIEPVDIITGGSPCQDLSVAGKRAGLAGERSGLFMEQIRIVKEMREHEQSIGRSGVDICPRWLIWENVAGAFSSNFRDGFGDFGAVLEEICKIKERDFSLPRLPNGGKYTKAGAIIGDGWSVAWRLHDAQYWGVPQRRRRIALVADFGGRGAPEILFERESVSRYSEQSEQAREEATRAVRAGTSEHGRILANGGGQVPYTLKMRGGKPGGGKGPLIQTDKSATLSALQDQTLFQPVFCIGNGQADQLGVHNLVGALDCMHDQKAVMYPVFCLQGNGTDRADTAGCNGAGWKEGTSYTLNTIDRHAVAFEAVCAGFSPQQGAKANGIGWQEECSPTLRSALCGSPPTAVVYDSKVVFDARGNGEGNISPTITGDHENRVTDYTAVCVEKLSRWIVRRLTPLECERLQGFPDGWTDIGDWTDSKGKKHKGDTDGPRYKALGNSIALPFWQCLLQNIGDTYDRPATLGSLFDGIGGFPLCHERINGKGTARWASEIEEFCIAVTKKHFEDI